MIILVIWDVRRHLSVTFGTKTLKHDFRTLISWKNNFNNCHVFFLWHFKIRMSTLTYPYFYFTNIGIWIFLFFQDKTPNNNNNFLIKHVASFPISNLLKDRTSFQSRADKLKKKKKEKKAKREYLFKIEESYIYHITLPI